MHWASTLVSYRGSKTHGQPNERHSFTQEKEYLDKRQNVLQRFLGEQDTWNLQHRIAAGWKASIWPHCILKQSCGVHWRQRKVQC